MAGHIKLDRKILTWEWYGDANTFRVFVHLLLMATYKDSNWQGTAIKRGQVITGRSKLSSALKISEQQTRTCLERLKSTKEITIETTKKLSIITICKYDIYQSFENYNNQQSTNRITNNQPTINQQDNQQSTTFNNENNNNKDNNNYINNSEGGFSPPYGVPPDVILPTVNFTGKDFNGLPDENCDSIINFLDVVKKIQVPKEQINSLWEVFKVQEITGQKLYRNKEDVYRHFLNWTKKQSFTKNVTARKPTVKKETGKVIGIEFINNFTQCKMSDGTIQDLNINQKDMARYNQINPNSIVKI